MKQEVEKDGCDSAISVQQGVDLGRWMGRRDAFAMIAGGCSSADIESLRRIRDEKHYRAVARNWDEFCTVHLRVSRRKVERNIAYLEEFGPQYFLLKQITHITPNEYRAIAPHVSSEGLQTNNGVVALLPEKSADVAAAVAELLRENQKAPEEPSAPEPANPGAPGDPSFRPILHHCEAALRIFEAYNRNPVPPDKLELTSLLARLWKLAGHQCVTIG